MAKPFLLVVDDDKSIAQIVARSMSDVFDCAIAASSAEALARMEEETVDVVLADICMPGMDGFGLLKELRNRRPDVAVVLMSGAGSVRNAVDAVQQGARDFVEKPFSIERMAVTLKNASDWRKLQLATQELRASLPPVDDLVGSSPPMQRLKELIERIASSEGRVLILGENGTGKELVATAIHRRSARAEGPFIKLNCGAVPAGLIESELFGHEKGAFTGATQARRGRFELADGGTLLLDEIAEMPLDLQVRLLRVLQEGEFERVGGSRTFKIDTRVIAATNRDLEEMVAQGKFREDLFYRLNVVTLRVPSLRERRGDIPALIASFGRRAGSGPGQKVSLAADALEALADYDFPGNVRELQNIVERLGIFCGTRRVERTDLHNVLPRRRESTTTQVHVGRYRAGVPMRALLEEAEREIVSEALKIHRGNKSAAARELQMERSYFGKKCRQLGLGDAVSATGDEPLPSTPPPD